MALKYLDVTNLCHRINRAGSLMTAAQPISIGSAGFAKQILSINKIIFFLTLKMIIKEIKNNYKNAYK